MVTGLSDIRADAVYPLGVVRQLLGWSQSTCTRKIRAGRLPVLPRGRFEPVKVLGSDLLSLLGSRAEALPPPSEKQSDRVRRAAEAVAEADRNVGAKAG